ncbi:MAG: DUF4372 domain-containing protein [Sphingobacteriaceae bacterium]
MVGQPIFKQIINLLPKNKFETLALSMGSDKYYKRFTTHFAENGRYGEI